MPITMPFSYSTVSNVYLLAPEIGSLTSLPSLDVHAFGGRAQARIDSKIVRLYSLPLTVEVPELQRLCEVIACYYIFRRLYTSERFNASPWPDRYKEALDDLNEVAAGMVPLVTATGAVLGGRTDIAEVWSNTKTFEPTFAPAIGIFEHVIDPDRTQDERDDRATS